MAFEMAELPMTTNQIEHLRLIDAHLERLLAIAEKRTPGEWTHQVSSSDPHRSLVNLRHANGVVATFATRSGDLNLEFAASCAGNAEAGWKATRAAIKHILSGGHGYDNGEDLLVESILAAFPLEILKHNDNP